RPSSSGIASSRIVTGRSSSSPAPDQAIRYTAYSPTRGSARREARDEAAASAGPRGAAPHPEAHAIARSTHPTILMVEPFDVHRVGPVHDPRRGGGGVTRSCDDEGMKAVFSTLVVAAAVVVAACSDNNPGPPLDGGISFGSDGGGGGPDGASGG